mmetsp:Transcript_15594/g.13635  ORF Transcript_15594/g.13635 Transcript_15594/m.13635 type:complete len:113 (-) Transcript_15594:25-363(-)
MGNFLANADMVLFAESGLNEEQKYNQVLGGGSSTPTKERKEIPEDWKERIEIHSMLEVAQGTMAWGERYLHNQFPYIQIFREDIDDSDYEKFKKHFKEKYFEYKEPMDKIYK